ncbi:Copine-5 [Merluccius polli]|uniref:Copine-5 n=1 Tax=Merluccius polli TaxID=89951 RepID=A0AA47NV74_MERPO|nr:Copine-5 [Merluccius polli]
MADTRSAGEHFWWRSAGEEEPTLIVVLTKRNRRVLLIKGCPTASFNTLWQHEPTVLKDLAKPHKAEITRRNVTLCGRWRERGALVIANRQEPIDVNIRASTEEKRLRRVKRLGDCPLHHFEGYKRDSATMQFCANKLDKKDFFGKSDPFMVFYRSNEDGTFTICHKTEVVKNTLNPVWQSFTIPVRALCNGDYDRTIKVEVYDWDRDGSHDFIGEFTTSYRELARGQSQFNVYEVINSKKKMKKKKYVNSGTVTLLSFSVESESTFLDYIKGGTQINFTVAIDFTASNGNPSQSTSLHYMNPYQLNAYAMALKAVGEIIQDYDSDKMFPALGFGAKLPPDGRVSHEFPLNGNIENPYCSGIEGILEAYHQSLKTVQLYGPTNFAPVVNHVARYAAAVQDGSQYFVLLIITDGVISDMAQTKEAIVNGAKLPMSIIIVGVGQAEFDAMVELDGDDIRVSSRGKLAERDIVQFVPFRDYMDRTGNHVLSMARLAKDVLAEIPDQFISYMKSRGIKPNPAPPPYTGPGNTHHHTQI